jgi:hypothetical protein
MVVGKGRSKDIADVSQKHDPCIVADEGLTDGDLFAAAVGWS